MHRLAKCLAAATLVLIFLGGLVKSTETGLSDRTWPQFNGGVEPVLHGATRFEHLHRLVAGTVAVLAIGLAVTVARRERRRWVRRLAAGAAALVLVQASFGGLTVLFRLESLGISLGHAALAQLFLCATVALASVTSQSWLGSGEREGERDRGLARLAAATTLAIYAQVLLGAWVRYTPGAPYAIPDFPLAYGVLVPRPLSGTVLVQFVHRSGAAVVTLLVAATLVASLRRREPILRRFALALAGILAAQILLGGFTIWTVKAVLPATLHVATGAALLATSLALTLFAFRLPLRATPPATRPLWRDLLVLTKARTATLVLAAAAAGFHLGSPGPVDLGRLAVVLLGTGLLAAGCSAVNQVIERETDARMRRTADRPLPAGRIGPAPALAMGLGLGGAGFITLFGGANPLAAWVGAATYASYVAIYTPLKRVTWLSTIAGAVPGALPPVIGWAGARGELPVDAWIVFAILFVWQLPHFFAIAWIYREDYARAGLRVLSVFDPKGLATGRAMALGSLGLLPLAVLPAMSGLAGTRYLLGSLALGATFAGAALAFMRTPSIERARRVFFYSLVYLPALLALLMVEAKR